jgi:hypothetical protein
MVTSFVSALLGELDCGKATTGKKKELRANCA